MKVREVVFTRKQAPWRLTHNVFLLAQGAAAKLIVLIEQVC